ncbi:class I SAM-dependent methyltransferase [Luedemannella helvata]
MKSALRPVVGERGWRALRRARRRLAGPAPAPAPAQAGLRDEPHPDDSHKMSRHRFLTELHEKLKPRTYLETGVSTGLSLALSRCRSIGIDPAFAITSEIRCDVALYREGSDDFFARPDPTAHFGGDPIDLAFIDGMHLFEYALRDFMNIERHAAAHSVIVVDDMLPRSVAEAARDRVTRMWTGDVFRLIPVLEKYRPDLVCRPVDTRPTGVLVVFGADPTSTVLWDHYDDIVRAYVRPDPQPVPAEILRRSHAVEPTALLAHGVWADLVAMRDAGGPERAALAAATATLPAK